ncbi:MAG: cell division protein FtsZ, partial [Proteobacteria bacterium]
MSDSENLVPPGAKIKVIGIGGGGGNAVNTMIRTGIEGVEFITANTDVQSLRFSLAERKIQIGKELTRGLGAGADPDIGRDAMLEDRHAISEALQGSNMVFVTAGMGGGTGTGGAAIAAQIAREQGALTVAVVTKPFAFEGKRRLKYAEEGIRRLEECVDTLITIPNQRLLEVSSPELSMIDAFRMADNVLVNAVKGISDIINVPGNLNVDFADVKTVMSSMGQALMGIGVGEGANRAKDAAQRAISSPLLEDVSIEGATGILINITANESLGIREVNEACSLIQEAAHEDAHIIFGTVI